MKKKYWIYLIFQFILFKGYGQFKGKLIDKTSGEPVSYASIWVENTDIGQSSDKNGEFEFLTLDTQKNHMLISHIGYEKLRIMVGDASDTIKLLPIQYLLNEVTVSNNLIEDKKIIMFPLTKVKLSLGGIGPDINASFISYDPKFSDTPTLSKISLITISKVSGAIFQIRIFEINKNGQPGRDLLPEAIICKAELGTKKITVDFKKYNFKIPTTGFFIGCERLILNKNKHFHSDEVWENGKWKFKKTFSYEPMFSGSPKPDFSYTTWSKDANGWNNKTNMRRTGSKKLVQNYPITKILYELELTN